MRAIRYRKFVRDLSRATLQLCLARLRPFLFPFPNLSLELFEMRSADVDLVEHRPGLSVVFKHWQCGHVGFLAGEHFKFLPLATRLYLRPISRRSSGDSFNPPNARCDRFLSNDAE